MILAIVSTMTGKAQLLYKISGNGLEKPSYILGTNHFAPISFVDSIPGIRQAMNETEQTYGEVNDMEKMTSPEMMQKVMQAMMMPEGVTLTSLLTEEEQGRLNGMLQNLIGVDMTNPMLAAQFDKLLPSAITTQLTVLFYLKKNPTFDINSQFDTYFQKTAKEQGKNIGGLETMDFQLETLLRGSSLERQKQQLMCFVDNIEYNEMVLEELVKAYFSQDMDAIEKVTEMKLNDDCDSTPEEEDRLIFNRNADWRQKMPEIMKQHPTLFAVGAAHLPGERGVLNLLRQAGYTVDGVKN